jgi:hypothetical protein
MEPNRTDDLTLKEILAELRTMDNINSMAERHGSMDLHEVSLSKALKTCNSLINDKALREKLGDDSLYWAVLMDSLENSLLKLVKLHKNVDFTLVIRYSNKVINKFFRKSLPIVSHVETDKFWQVC